MLQICPKISIITPSFNQGSFLEETIISILEQNYQNLEYIIIDGGSSDNSVDIIKKYEKKMSYWISEKDNGQSNAINKGLKRATGDIITWINSDDLLMPGVLNMVPKYFENPSTGLIFGKNIGFGENILEWTSKIPSDDLISRCLGYMAFPQPASFFRRESLKGGFLDEALHFGMDYDLIVRVLLNYDVKPVDAVISKYRFHKESKSVSLASKFSFDWAKTFSKFLRSLPKTEKYIEVMDRLGLYHDDSSKYQTSKNLSDREIKLALIYHLSAQAQSYYGAYELRMASKIAAEVKKLDGNYYKKLKLNDLAIKSILVPPFFLKFIKSLK